MKRGKVTSFETMKSEETKQIQNTSLQGLTIILNTPVGFKELFLRPKATVIVPVSWNSKILETLILRKQVRVKILN